MHNMDSSLMFEDSTTDEVCSSASGGVYWGY